MKKLILLLILIFSLPVAAQNFTIGKSTFLLNGKPFTVKAAELHYTRIPAPYWEHRIEMCKALGMNTICLYVFWNIHEQTEGQFDFTGQNDIAAFCRLAQKHGMYVIVRPGPYVCAEWEMGGLPWWLLKKRNFGKPGTFHYITNSRNIGFVNCISTIFIFYLHHDNVSSASNLQKCRVYRSSSFSM